MIESIVDRLDGFLYRCLAAENFRMEYVSQGIKRVIGVPAEDLISGRVAFMSLVHENDRRLIDQTFNDALAHREGWNFDYRLIARDGREIWMNEVGAGIFEDGDLIYLEGALTVVDGKKRAESEKLRLADLAIAASSEIVMATKAIFNLLKQLRILALNSRIEAARAGDAGRGFAVVAQEMTVLAAGTNDLAVSINATTERLRSAFEPVLGPDTER